MGYAGYKVLRLDDDVLSQLYTYGNLGIGAPEFLVNEYLIATDKDDNPVDYFRYTTDGIFVRVPFPTITSEMLGEVKPRNPEQYVAMDMLKNETSKVKLIRGVYGSGKDLLELNYSLSQLDSGKYQKIVFVRNNITVDNVPDIGFLPNGMEDKLGWTLYPLADKLGNECISNMMHAGLLELVPLLFIRGRSFDNSIIYVTEGQNMTTELIKLIISRCGNNSIIIINADNHQTDRRIFDTDNGITKMVERLAGDPLFAYTYLSKTERGAVANLANKLDN